MRGTTPKPLYDDGVVIFVHSYLLACKMFVEQDKGSGNALVFELLVSLTVIISEKSSQNAVDRSRTVQEVKNREKRLLRILSLTVFPALLTRFILILTPHLLTLPCRKIDEQIFRQSIKTIVARILNE